MGHVVFGVEGSVGARNSTPPHAIRITYYWDAGQPCATDEKQKYAPCTIPHIHVPRKEQKNEKLEIAVWKEGSLGFTHEKKTNGIGFQVSIYTV